jgi:hypothetical protein
MHIVIVFHAHGRCKKLQKQTIEVGHVWVFRPRAAAGHNIVGPARQYGPRHCRWEGGCSMGYVLQSWVWGGVFLGDLGLDLLQFRVWH